MHTDKWKDSALYRLVEKSKRYDIIIQKSILDDMVEYRADQVVFALQFEDSACAARIYTEVMSFPSNDPKEELAKNHIYLVVPPLIGGGVVHGINGTVPITIKFLRSEDRTSEIARTLKFIAQDFQHPSLIPITVIKCTSSVLIYSMPHLPSLATELFSALHAPPVASPEYMDLIASRLVSDVAPALQYLHDRNWVHMDVKLGNMGLNSDGKFILFDVGSASEIGGEPTFVTERYVPAEVCLIDNAVLNPAPVWDWYALATSVMQLLTKLRDRKRSDDILAFYQAKAESGAGWAQTVYEKIQGADLSV